MCFIMLFINVFSCYVPNCDKPGTAVYDESWVQSAVPGTTDPSGLFKPEQCERFVSRDTNCGVESFYRNQTVRCDQWVFDEYEKTIVQEVKHIHQNFIFNFGKDC